MMLTYLAEVFPGDKLDLLVSAGSNRLVYILGGQSDTNTNVFVMEVLD